MMEEEASRRAVNNGEEGLMADNNGNSSGNVGTAGTQPANAAQQQDATPQANAARVDPFRDDNVINGDLPLTRVVATVVSLQEVGSTNTVAEQYITSGRWNRNGMTIVAAREQTAGRGRLDHTWFSVQDKSFTMSFVSAVGKTVAQNPQLNGWLQIIAGLAVLDGLRETLSETDMELVRDPSNIDDTHDDVMLKWPNDIVYHGRKLGGILAQVVHVPDPDIVAIVYGVGLNIDVPLSEMPTEQSTSWQLITRPGHRGERPSTAAVMDLIASRTARHMQERLWVFGENPKEAADHLWRRLMQETWTIGHPIVVHYANGETEYGIARGINGDASLLMTTDGGEEKIVRTADVGVLPVEP